MRVLPAAGTLLDVPAQRGRATARHVTQGPALLRGQSRRASPARRRTPAPRPPVPGPAVPSPTVYPMRPTMPTGIGCPAVDRCAGAGTAGWSRDGCGRAGVAASAGRCQLRAGASRSSAAGCARGRLRQPGGPAGLLKRPLQGADVQGPTRGTGEQPVQRAVRRPSSSATRRAAPPAAARRGPCSPCRAHPQDVAGAVDVGHAQVG